LPLIIAAAAGCVIVSQSSFIYRLGAWTIISTLGIAALGAASRNCRIAAAWPVHCVFYFYLVNVAAIIGVAMAIIGRVEVLWTPEREYSEAVKAPPS